MPRCKAYPTGPPFPQAVLDVRPWWDVMILVSSVLRNSGYVDADAYSVAAAIWHRNLWMNLCRKVCGVIVARRRWALLPG